MNVEVAHALLGVWPGVDHDTVPTVAEPLGFRYRPHRLKQPAEHPWVDTCDCVQPGQMLSGHDEDMDGSLRLNVAERHRFIIVIDDIRGKVAGNDPAKEAVGHGSVYLGGMNGQTLQDLNARYGGALDRALSARLQGDGELEFFGMMQYQFGYVDEQLQPASTATGKRFRPLLCLFATEAVGGDWEGALTAAAAIELLHNFSLIHDDIEDRDPSRRHRPTVWKLWGEPQAINVGDAVFAEATRTVLSAHPDPAICLQIARSFGDCVLRLTEGQYMDMSFETRGDVLPGEYLRMIELKTAQLIAFSLWAGSLIGGAGPPEQNALHVFGFELGKAFQIHDDILGIWAPREQTGKEVAMDLQNRKKTLPVLLAAAAAAEKERALLQAFFRREHDDLEAVLSVLAATNARHLAEADVTRRMAAADRALAEAGLPPDYEGELRALAAQLTGQ
jgi:geranylgeranyl diphosphate synthase type I